MVAKKPLRWGLFSASKICFDFCVAMSTVSRDEHVITHVGARNIESAQKRASEFNIPKASGSYEAVAMDTDVDVIYIGAINTKHKELSLLAFEYGKAVLCEKPATMNGRELEEVLKKAEEKNVFYMEAEWTRFFPLYRDLKPKITGDGSLGSPRALLVSFGIAGMNEVEGIRSKDLGGSILLAIGIYNLLVMDMMMEGFKLIEMKACGHVTKETNVDRSVVIAATFEGNRTVQMMCSGDTDLPNEVTMVCDKGKVTVKAPFWSPESYTEHVQGNEPKEFKFPLPKAEKQTNFPNSVGLRYEAEHVRECLMKGLKQSPIMSHETSRRIMRYMDDVRRQIGSTHAL